MDDQTTNNSGTTDVPASTPQTPNARVAKMFMPNLNSLTTDQGDNTQQKILKNQDWFKKLQVDQPPTVPTKTPGSKTIVDRFGNTVDNPDQFAGKTPEELHTMANLKLEEARKGYSDEMKRLPPDLAEMKKERFKKAALGTAVGSIIAGLLGNRMHQSSAGMNFKNEKQNELKERLNDEYNASTHKFNQARELAFAKSQFNNEDAQRALGEIQGIEGKGAAATSDWLKRANIASTLTGKQEQDQTKLDAAADVKFSKDWAGALGLLRNGQSPEIRLLGLALLKNMRENSPEKVGRLNLPEDQRLGNFYQNGGKTGDDELDKILQANGVGGVANPTPKENLQGAQMQNLNTKTNVSDTMLPINVAKGESVTDLNNARVDQVKTQGDVNKARIALINKQVEELPKKIQIAWFNANTARQRAEAAIAKGHTGKGSVSNKNALIAFKASMQLQGQAQSDYNKSLKAYTDIRKSNAISTAPIDETKFKNDVDNKKTFLDSVKQNVVDDANNLRNSLKRPGADLRGPKSDDRDKDAKIKNRKMNVPNGPVGPVEPDRKGKGKKVAMNEPPARGKPFNPFALLNKDTSIEGE